MDTSYFRYLVILNGAVPFAVLLWDASRGHLGANTVSNALHITGILSLVFLFISLAVTPLRHMTGWNWLIACRRSLGLYGFFYALAHLVIYVVWDRMGSIVSTAEEIIARRFLTIGFIALLLMVPLAVTSTNAMIRRIGASRWKLLHRLAYVVAILGVVHYYMLVKSDTRQPIAFAIALTPLLGFRVVRGYLGKRSLAKQPVKRNAAPVAHAKTQFFRGELVVEAIRQETADVKTFRFVNPQGGEIPFRHQPGQYLTLHLKIDGASIRRSYTIASSPTQRSYVELTIKRHSQGIVSNYMHQHVQVGQRVQLSAPGGKFWFDGAKHDRVLLIAGGVGITPTMSMLRYLTDTNWQGEIYFLNAVRTEQDLIFSEELKSLVSRNPKLVLVNFFSQVKAQPLTTQTPLEDATRARVPFVRPGYIDATAIRQCIPNLSNMPVYLCGPEPMMVAMRAELQQLGVSGSNIFTEEFVSPSPSAATSDTTIEDVSPVSEATAAQVRFTKSGQTLQVDREQTILEAAELNDVEVAFECRAGICGQCKVRCLSGRVTMEATDALSPAERRSGWILACQAKAASESLEIEA